MDYGLAKEIYGMQPWCMDSISLQSMTSILKNLQNGVQLAIPETKYNQFFVLDLKNNTKLVSENWQLKNDNITEAIGVINLDGPITKNGGASSYGTKELSSTMLKMSKDERVKGFVINVDSGGGSSAAVNLMVDAINEVKKTKPVYSVVSKGGMAASAAYGISSAANKMFSEEEMNIVGSVGTMISFEGRPANSTAKDGTKNIVLYASKSTEKNKAFNEALDNDNYDLLVNDLLDPINESFINTVLNNRPQLKGSNFDNGHTVFAKDGIGTFIDGIASFDEVVQMVLNDSKSNNNKSSLINNSSKMTRADLQNQFPDLASSIVEEGINQERERVKSWLVYSSADSDSVIEGIKSGEKLTDSKREEFMVKMNSKNQLENFKNDSAPAVATEETPVSEEKTTGAEKNPIEEAANFYKSLISKNS